MGVSPVRKLPSLPGDGNTGFPAANAPQLPDQPPAMQKTTKFGQLKKLLGLPNILPDKSTAFLSTNPITLLQNKGINLDEIVNNSTQADGTTVTIREQKQLMTYTVKATGVDLTLTCPTSKNKQKFSLTRYIQTLWAKKSIKQKEYNCKDGKHVFSLADGTTKITLILSNEAANLYGSTPTHGQPRGFSNLSNGSSEHPYATISEIDPRSKCGTSLSSYYIEPSEIMPITTQTDGVPTFAKRALPPIPGLQGADSGLPPSHTSPLPPITGQQGYPTPTPRRRANNAPDTVDKGRELSATVTPSISTDGVSMAAYLSKNTVSTLTPPVAALRGGVIPPPTTNTPTATDPSKRQPPPVKPKPNGRKRPTDHSYENHTLP